MQYSWSSGSIAGFLSEWTRDSCFPLSCRTRIDWHLPWSSRRRRYRHFYAGLDALLHVCAHCPGSVYVEFHRLAVDPVVWRLLHVTAVQEPSKQWPSSMIRDGGYKDQCEVHDDSVQPEIERRSCAGTGFILSLRHRFSPNV